MFRHSPSRRSRMPQAAISLLLHSTLLVAGVHAFHRSAVRVLIPGTVKGTRIDLTYNPGRAPVPVLKTDRPTPSTPKFQPLVKTVPAATVQAILEPALTDLPRPHLPPLRQSSPVSSAPPATSPDPAAGSDSRGSGDVQIALTTYSPSPRPDLSTLPKGTQGDVILDVTIDPLGQVADLQVLRALGYGVESKVVDTVRTWKFSPATRDGVAVASVQELHFHFGPV